MNNFITKSSLILCVASIAIKLTSCNSDYVNSTREQLEKELGGLNRKNIVSFMIGNVKYIGAENSDETTANRKHIWAYDTKTKVWSQVADFPKASQDDKDPRADQKGKFANWKYDPVSNSWRKP